MFLRAVLPEPHLTGDSKDVMKLGTGLIATMSALVLGLLIASAKSSFDSQRAAFQQLATNVILLDRALAHYGPESKQARALLRQSADTLLQRLWPEDGAAPSKMDALDVTTRGSELYSAIRDLTPQKEYQRAAQTQALQLGAELGRTYWMWRQADETAIPRPFLVVLIFWLSVLFISFGLFSAHNTTVIVVLLVCALSVAGALFLIVDLDNPFDGLIQVSSTPLRNAVAQIGQ